MRPLRRASLLLAFYLLASAATAYAECAWVAWVHIMTTTSVPATGDWWPTAAYKAQSECEPYARRLTKRMEDQNPDRLVEYVCLPDTVDPRGPKGK